MEASKCLRSVALDVGRDVRSQSALWFIVLTAQILKAQTLNIAFLSRVSILTRDIDIANLSVRPFVCLSVRP